MIIMEYSYISCVAFYKNSAQEENVLSEKATPHINPLEVTLKKHHKYKCFVFNVKNKPASFLLI